MRIVVHGQQAFGKAVLEALIKRGENVVAAYVAPEKPGQKADPLKEAAIAAKLSVYQGVGHSPFFEDAPRFNAELAAFVRSAQKVN